MYKLIILAIIFRLVTVEEQVSAQQNPDQSHLQFSLDTLQNVVSHEHHTNKLDSLLNEVNERLDSLKKNIKDPRLYLGAVKNEYDKLSKQLNDMDSLSLSLGSKINRIDSLLSEKNARIDSLLQSIGLSGTEINLNAYIIDGKIPTIPSLPLDQTKLPLSKLPELQNHFHNSDLSLINPISTSLKILEEKVSPLNGPPTVHSLSNASEDIVKKLKPVNEFTKSQGKAESLLKQADNYSTTLQDPEALREKAKEAFIDHLAGKEELVKKDLEDIARLQTKYRDIADSRLLPKHKWKTNAMKNKPFVERVIPGIGLQVFNSDNISLDAAPTLSYKVSGVFQSGVSAFARVTYFKREESLRLVNCYGARLFSQAKILNNFHLYGELERYKPDPISSAKVSSTVTQSESKDLQNKVNIGLLHSHAIGKRLSGYLVVLYDVLQIRKFPNSIGSSARFGFQYELKKKKK